MSRVSSRVYYIVSGQVFVVFDFSGPCEPHVPCPCHQGCALGAVTQQLTGCVERASTTVPLGLAWRADTGINQGGVHMCEEMPHFVSHSDSPGCPR